MAKSYRGRSENVLLIHDYSLAKHQKPYQDLDAKQQLSVRRAASKDPRYVKKNMPRSLYHDNKTELPQETEPNTNK